MSKKKEDFLKGVVSEFHRLTPLFEAYAKALYGKPIGVKIPPKGMAISAGSAAFSDGKNIYILPPLSLGQKIDHSPDLCGQNDENGVALCKGCAKFEEVFAMVCHEIAHYTGGSFEVSTHQHIRNTEEAEKKYPGWGKIAMNLLEDFRVENQMYGSSVGTRVMRRGMVNKLVVPKLTGETPMNNWASFALLSRAYDQNYPGVIYPEEIQELLADPKVNSVLQKAAHASDYAMSYLLLDPFMEVVNGHGFFCNDNRRSDDVGSDESSPSVGEKSKTSDSGSGEDSETSDGSSDESSKSTEKGSAKESESKDSSTDPEDKDSGDSPGSEAVSESPDFDGYDEGSAAESDGMGSETTSHFRSKADESSRSCGKDEETDTDGVPVHSLEADRGSETSGEADESEADESGVSDEETDTDSDPRAGGAESRPEPVRPSEGTDVPESATDDSAADSEPLSGTVDARDLTESESPRGARSTRREIKMGTPEEAKELIELYSGHTSMEGSVPEGEEITQIQEFEAVYEDFGEDSGNITDVKTLKYSVDRGWMGTGRGGGYESSIKVSGGVLEKTLSRMRVLFAENDKSKRIPNLKSGKVNTRALGKRAPLSDPRIFKKKINPKKRDYAVVLVLDASGSTAGGSRLMLEKAALEAQADILNSLGIKFAIVAHSGENSSSGWDTYARGWTFIKGVIKDWNDPWSSIQRRALNQFPPLGANLDGHAMLIARRMVMQPKVTDRIVMYYSDGGMPAEDAPSQGALLRREIKWMQQRGIIVAGVGVFSDAPKQHGLPTVRLDKADDLPLVVGHLEKLMER